MVEHWTGVEAAIEYWKRRRKAKLDLAISLGLYIGCIISYLILGGT